MSEVLTYSLRFAERAHNSDEYYRTIAVFADKWLAHAQNTVGDLVRDFESFREAAGPSERSFAEGAFEALALGVQLREHATEAALLPQWSAWVLKELVETQAHWPWAEGAIKAVRGFVGGLVEEMVENGHAAKPTSGNSQTPAGQPSIRDLILWLQAQGETTQAGRFSVWQDYLQTMGEQRARQVILQCLALAADFTMESAAALGKYTQGVEEFVGRIAPQTGENCQQQCQTRHFTSPFSCSAQALHVPRMTMSVKSAWNPYWSRSWPRNGFSVPGANWNMVPHTQQTAW